MKIVKTPLAAYVLFALAIVFLCIGTFEMFASYSNIRELIETNNLVVSENIATIISVYIERCAVYFGIAFLLYAAGGITSKLNEVHQITYQMAELSKKEK